MENKSNVDVDTGVDFRTAKIEHYLERADDLIHMARYGPALLALQRVLDLDPANAAAEALRQDASLSRERLYGSYRPNGSTNSLMPNGRKQLVLIVDQDERVLLTLTDSLRRGGLEVVTAGGYHEAVQLLDRVCPDVIVSEVNFEGGPVGFDLYLHLSSSSMTSAIPFLFLATRIDRDTLIAGKRRGVDDFILKPVDEEVVIVSIMNCLARRKQVTVTT